MSPTDLDPVLETRAYDAFVEYWSDRSFQEERPRRKKIRKQLDKIERAARKNDVSQMPKLLGDGFYDVPADDIEVHAEAMAALGYGEDRVRLEKLSTLTFDDIAGRAQSAANELPGGKGGAPQSRSLEKLIVTLMDVYECAYPEEDATIWWYDLRPSRFVRFIYACFDHYTKNFRRFSPVGRDSFHLMIPPTENQLRRVKERINRSRRPVTSSVTGEGRPGFCH